MQEYAIEPDGLKELKVYHCIGTEPQRTDSQEVGIRFASIDRFVMAELLDLSAVQHDLFVGLYYDVERQSDRKPRRQRGVVATLSGEEERPSAGIDLADLISAIEAKLGQEKVEARISWQVILRKLRKLRLYGIFDSGKDLGDYSCLMQSQSVSVFDLSGSQNVIINNILISDILRGLFEQKVRDKERRLPPTLAVIEEAHTFVSKDNVSRMEETLDILRDISRRGRKRWLSLCFISQQPSHLPPEIYELCNTKVVHQTTGGKNLNALKDSAGGVNEAIWDEVPVLGQGRCLIISPQFRHPVLCDVRPCKTQRKFTE
jgi:DNA helicase HerA-like ATPase